MSSGKTSRESSEGTAGKARSKARRGSGAGEGEGFSPEEIAAMKERAKEVKAAARRRSKKEDGEKDLLAKVAEMEGSDRVIAEGLHALITATAPELAPKTWYGMPAYARDGKVVCFFQAASKFKTRYATFGFSGEAKLDDGALWPVAFALTAWTAAEAAEIEALLKKATG